MGWELGAADVDLGNEEEELTGSFHDYIAFELSQAIQRVQAEYRRLHGSHRVGNPGSNCRRRSTASSSNPHGSSRLGSKEVELTPASGDMKRKNSRVFGSLVPPSSTRLAKAEMPHPEGAHNRRDSIIMFGDLGVYPPPLPVAAKRPLVPCRSLRREGRRQSQAAMKIGNLGPSQWNSTEAQVSGHCGVMKRLSFNSSTHDSAVVTPAALSTWTPDTEARASENQSSGRHGNVLRFDSETEGEPCDGGGPAPDDAAERHASLRPEISTKDSVRSTQGPKSERGSLRLEHFILPKARRTCTEAVVRTARFKTSLRKSNGSAATSKSQQSCLINSSMVDTVQGLNSCCSEEWTLYPNSLFYRAWTYFISTLIIANCFFTPLQVAFMEDIPNVEVFDTITDVFFGLDILLSFNVAFATKTQLHTNRRVIFYNNLLSRRLWIALAATIPFDSVFFLVARKDEPSHRHIGTALGLLRLLRINRLIILFHDLQRNTAFNLLGVVVAKFVLFILLCTHTSGCIFYALARFSDYDETTWVPKVSSALPRTNIFTRYVHVLFWAVGTFKAGPTHSSITPTSNSEMILAVFTMIVNICLNTYLVSNLSALLMSSDVRIYAFRKEVGQLNEFGSRYSLPKELREQVENFLRFKFMTNQELDQTVLTRLPELYRQRISRVLYEDVVGSVDLFTGCQQLFLLQLHSSFMTTLYMPSQCLAIVDEPCTSLQILSEGSVELFHRGNSVDFCEIGESFSAVSFLCKVGHRFMVRTCLFTRVLSLDHVSWDHACSGYPENLNQVKVNLLAYCRDKSFMFEEDTSGRFAYHELYSIVEANLVQQREMGIAMMCSAAGRGDVAELKRLLVGLSPNCANQDGRTPLHLAASSGELEAIRTLIEKTAQVNAVDNFGRSPLLEACKEYQDDAARLLFAQGAILGTSLRTKISTMESITTREVSEELPCEADWLIAMEVETYELCCAAAAIDKLWYLKALLRYEADPNHVDYNLRTPLHVACTADNTFAVKAFVSNPSTKLSELDRFGQSPMIEAVRQGHEECAAILKGQNAFHGYLLDANDRKDPLEILAGQELCSAASSNQVALLQRLVTYCDLKVDAPDRNRRTALMAACSACSVEAAAFLVEQGADVNSTDRFGNTPVSEARRHDSARLLAALRGPQAEALERR